MVKTDTRHPTLTHIQTYTPYPHRITPQHLPNTPTPSPGVGTRHPGSSPADPNQPPLPGNDIGHKHGQNGHLAPNPQSHHSINTLPAQDNAPTPPKYTHNLTWGRDQAPQPPPRWLQISLLSLGGISGTNMVKTDTRHPTLTHIHPYTLYPHRITTQHRRKTPTDSPGVVTLHPSPPPTKLGPFN